MADEALMTILKRGKQKGSRAVWTKRYITARYARIFHSPRP